ncbi:hypothetical protein KAT36_03220 [Candidatus Pacearchaeota archaeon]|nr:hypothetical protein [Candidatus Pacearchaeota archaeon]
MDKWRNRFDKFYDWIKPIVFSITKKNPEQAHWAFTNFCQTLNYLELDKKVLDNESNQKTPPWKISNAAGFNKNAEFSSRIIEYLGFDRMVVGTATADEWKGNVKPRIIRFPESDSMVNWMGLPGIGAERVARRLQNQGNEGIPITINLMSTPEKSGKDMLRDLEKTVLSSRYVPRVDRFELNISCPNIWGNNNKMDVRTKYRGQLKNMLDIVKKGMTDSQDLYIKVSPDLCERDVDEILRACEAYDVRGFTTTNTTTNHNPRYIPKSPDKGGASGNAVYKDSIRVQELFADRTDAKLIACGGINSITRARERCSIGNTSEIQLYTPIIFSGPKLLRNLREAI